MTSTCMSDLRGAAMVEVLAAVEPLVARRDNLVLVGPPGVGRTMVARRIAGILPTPSILESAWIEAEHTGAGLGAARFRDAAGHRLPIERPFRAPHHTVSAAGLVGTHTTVGVFG